MSHFGSDSERSEGCTLIIILIVQRSKINSVVHRFVAVPPQKPTIIDEKGKEILSVAGPYEEGGEMKLTCIVAGGEFRRSSGRYGVPMHLNK